jgi:hypothetical protein
VVGFCAASLPAFAQIRRDRLVVKMTAGTNETVMLAPNWSATAVVPSDLSAIAAGNLQSGRQPTDPTITSSHERL